MELEWNGRVLIDLGVLILVLGFIKNRVFLGFFKFSSNNNLVEV